MSWSARPSPPASRRVAVSSLRLSHPAWIVLAVMLVGLNLRPILASVGPVLDDIQRLTGLSNEAAGLLTTLPVLAMGLCALWAGRLHDWLGEARGVLWGLIVIALACMTRLFWHAPAGLILTAAAGGLGIAVVQALMPTYIKRQVPQRAGQVMGLYTTGIMAGAACAATASAPLAARLEWPSALSVWALAALVAAMCWRGVAGNGAARGRALRGAAPLRSRRAWMLMTFFGVGTGAYTLVLAWLPPYYTALGWSSADSGLLLGAVTVAEVVAGLTMSALVGRITDRRRLLVPVLCSALAGFACLILAPSTLAIPAVVLIGLGIGSLFPLSLITTMDHASDPVEVGALLGFVQGGGYILASIMPFAAGVIRAHFDSLTQAWIIMAAGMVGMLIMSTRFSPSSARLHERGRVTGA